MTLTELFELWLERRSTKVGVATVGNMKTINSSNCKILQKLKYASIKVYQTQEIIGSCGYGYSTLHQSVLTAFG